MSDHRALRMLAMQGYVYRFTDEGELAVEWQEADDNSWLINTWPTPLSAVVDLKYLGWPVTFEQCTSRVISDIADTKALLNGLMTDWALQLTTVFQHVNINGVIPEDDLTVDGVIALHDAARIMTARLQIGLDTLARLLHLATDMQQTTLDAYNLSQLGSN